MGEKICPWCWYARMKTDICGIYCTGGFVNPEGNCDHFLSTADGKKRKREERKARKGKDAEEATA